MYSAGSKKLHRKRPQFTSLISLVLVAACPIKWKAYLIGVKLYYQPDETISYLCCNGMLKPEEFLSNCFTGMTISRKCINI
jgi:hypothetical protein